jgi:hypothetical protein
MVELALIEPPQGEPLRRRAPKKPEHDPSDPTNARLRST